MTPDEQKKQQEKIDNKRRQVVKSITNRLLSQFSFQNIKTWGDIYKFTGYDSTYVSANFTPEQISKPVTIVDVRSWCKKLTDDLEDTLKGKETNEITTRDLQNKSIEHKNSEEKKEISNTDSQLSSSSKNKESQADESGFNSSNDYGLPPSDKEKAYLYWFQKKSCKEILDKITILLV